MSNKTCGECKYFNPLSDTCIKYGKQMAKTNTICAGIPTNGDKICQMSNAELVAFLNRTKYPPICDDVPKEQCKSCSECWLNWLNAPAESEGGGE